MIPGWPAGQVAISVALLVDQADQIQKAQGSELDGDQFCELVQDVCYLMADYLVEGDPPKLIIAHVGA